MLLGVLEQQVLLFLSILFVGADTNVANCFHMESYNICKERGVWWFFRPHFIKIGDRIYRSSLLKRKGRLFMKSQDYSHQDLVRIAQFTPNDLARIRECRQDHTRLGFAYRLAYVRLHRRFPSQ